MPDASGGLSLIDPSERSLLAKTAHGAGWMIGWRFATRALGLLSTLALVRLLLPADFGLVALGASLAQALDAMAYLGVEEQVIREPAPGRPIYDTAFTMNVLRSLCTAVLVAVLAYPAAAFFHEPRLAWVMLALGLGLCISAFENIGTVNFRRDFAFDKEFRLLVTPRIIGIVLSIGYAVIFRTYWALIVGALATRVTRLMLGYAMHPYRPRLSLVAWHRIFGFSFWTWLITLVSLVRDRIDSVAIGRVLSTVQVGTYAIAAEIAALPSTELVEPMCRACFSAFAVARHTGAGAVSTYRRVLRAIALLTLPAGFGISLVADPVVRLLLGPKWLAAIPLLQVFGIGYLLNVFGLVSGTMMNAHGRLRSNFRINVAATVLRLILVPLLLLKFGLIGAAVGATIAIAGEQALYVASMFRSFGLRFRDLLADIWRPLVGVAVMAAVLVGSGMGWSGSAASPLRLIGGLASSCTLGAAVYVAVVLILWLAAGRPAGAELDLLELASRLRGRIMQAVWRRPATQTGRS